MQPALTEASQAKLFEDAYSNRPDSSKDNLSFATERHVLEREAREAAFYRQQLIVEERRLLAEIFFMMALYQYYERFSRYYAPYTNYWTGQYLRNDFRHLGQHLHHWSRPRVWLHEAEKTGHAFGRQWHDWSTAGAGLAGRLITDARHNIGQPVWAFTKFASVCQAGNLGCAATVSELLQESGVKIAGSAGVYEVVDQLSKSGWQRIKISDKQQFRPGDVVFGVRGSHGHIGIISQTNNGQVLVCDNSSSTGTLKERTIESGGSFTPDGRFAGNLYVMRQTSG